MMIVAPMAVFGWVGYKLDRRLGTSPWLLLAGLLAGMAGGFASFFRFVLPPAGAGRRGRGDDAGARPGDPDGRPGDGGGE
jgi:F0F1-type ATP synthase assembly protein I